MGAGSTRQMQLLGPSEASLGGDAPAGGQDVLLPCSALALGSQGDPVQTSYGVQCLLHVEDSLSLVTVSSLARRAEFLDDTLLERAKQRVLAFRANPHPHIAAPLGLVIAPDANATQSLLLVEKAPSSSSLQSMILHQMEAPQRPAYSWKSALEWLVQIAAAIAHAHEVHPEAPHGRISSRAIFVTSASGVCLGRAISAASLAPSDASPTPKRLHTDDSAHSAVSRTSSDSTHSPRQRAGFSMFLPRPRHALDAAQMGLAPCADVMHTALKASLLQPERISDPGALRSSGRLSSRQGSTPLATSAPHITESGLRVHRSTFAADSDVTETPDSSSGRLQRATSTSKLVRASAGVSYTDLPGMGRVMRVAMPPRRAQSARRSLFDAAEAAVWSRSDTGTEVKQHGGGFFSQGIASAQTLLSSGSETRSLSASVHASQATSDAASSPVVVSPMKDQAKMDAADTEHVLLGGRMMWDPSAALVSSPEGSADGGVSGRIFAAPHGNASSDAASPVARVVARLQLEPNGHAAAAWANARACGTGAAHSMAPKRSRSGLSNRLPSLVELPMEEDEAERVGGGGAGGRGTQFDMRETKSVSVPGGWTRSVTEEAAARGGAGPGRGQYSSSSPGVAVRSDLGGQGGHRCSADASSSGEHDNAALVLALARAARNAPMLSLVRAAMCKAAFGQGFAHLSQPAAPVAPVGDAPRAQRRSSDSDRADAKRHGSQVLMEALEAQQASARQRWLQVMSDRGPRPTSASQGSARADRRLDDLPYRAPELAGGSEVTQAADVYAFAVVMYEVSKQELLVADVAIKADLEGLEDEAALRAFTHAASQGERPHVPLSWPQDLKELIQLCWHANPYSRPPMAQVHATLLEIQANYRPEAPFAARERSTMQVD